MFAPTVAHYDFVDTVAIDVQSDQAEEAFAGVVGVRADVVSGDGRVQRVGVEDEERQGAVKPC